MIWESPLLWLEPANERARDVVLHNRLRNPSKNRVSGRSGSEAIGIGHIDSKSGGTTLAVLGRSSRRADIEIPRKVSPKYISRVHCSFEIDPKTGIVFLCDKNGQSVASKGQPPVLRLRGPSSHGFSSGRAVLLPDLNTEFSIGMEGFGEVRFRIMWFYDRPGALKNGKRLFRDASAPARSLFSFTRFNDAGTSPATSSLTWAEIEELRGGLGVRFLKAVDVHSGKLVAVKTLEDPIKHNYKVASLVSEVEILRKAKHPRVVELISSHGWKRGPIEILLQHMQGDFSSIINTLYQEQDGELFLQDICRAVLHDILDALVFIHGIEIVHHQVEPRNIFFTLNNDRFRFYLGNFSLSTMKDDSGQIITATDLYMAPECFKEGPKTSAIDIWALYVTIINAFDNTFRNQMSFLIYKPNILDVVRKIASEKNEFFGSSNVTCLRLGHLRPMAEINPDQRATAAHMLKVVTGLDRDPVHGQRVHDSFVTAAPADKSILNRLFKYGTKQA